MTDSSGPAKKRSFRMTKRDTTAPVLVCPDFDRLFILQTDASAYGLAAVLTLNLEQGEWVVAFTSQTLNPAEELQRYRIRMSRRRMGYPSDEIISKAIGLR